VLSSSIVVLAMSGGVAAAAADTKSVLVVDKIAEVDFGPISGTRVPAVSVGTTSDGRVWLTAPDALLFACGGASIARAQQKLAAMVKADGEPEGFHRGRWKPVPGATCPSCPHERGCASARRHRRCRAGLWLELRLRLPPWASARQAAESHLRSFSSSPPSCSFVSKVARRARNPQWRDLDTPKVFCRSGTNNLPLTFAYVPFSGPRLGL